MRLIDFLKIKIMIFILPEFHYSLFFIADDTNYTIDETFCE